MTLRLASVNLFSGRSPRDGQIDDARTAAAVAGLDADVLALQEVDRGQPRSAGTDQARLVAEAAGAVTHRFVPLVAGTPGVPGWRPVRPDAAGPERVPDGPTYGIALASRRPVAAWHVLGLDPSRARWPVLLPARPPRLLWIRDDPRAALAAVLSDPPIVVACTHLSFVPGVNAAPLRRVRTWLDRIAADAAAPLVLLGDLNLPGRLPARITGWTPLVRAPSYPAPVPRTQLDHALARGPVRARSARMVPLPVSDHRAVVLDVTIGPDHRP